MSEKCCVSWCPALAVGQRGCAAHAKRPVLHSLEGPDAWKRRILAEDRAAKKHVEKRERNAANAAKRRNR